MKITMIGQKGIPTQYGGIERHAEALAVRLGAMGHEVLVYTRAWYAAPQANFAPGVRTVATVTVRSKHLDAIVHTLTATVHAIREGADVFHYHGVGPALLSWIPRVFAPAATVIATFHCIDRKHQKWGKLAQVMLGLGEWAACRFPHATITVSKTLQSYCENRFNREAKYVPNGVDEAPGEIGDEALGRFGLAKDRYVAMVSRLVRHKGAHRLIEAYNRLHAENRHGGMKLAIVGDSAFTDEYVVELRRLAEGNPDIVFTGYLQGRELEETFANAYAIAHPSESEGLPIAILEAMRYGKTVLAADIPENMEVVREHGLHFRNRDTDDLAEKLAALIADPELAASKGLQARTFVLRDYRWDDVAIETARIYKKLRAGKTATHAVTAA